VYSFQNPDTRLLFDYIPYTLSRMASQDSQPTYVRKIDSNQPITEGIVTGYIAWQLSVYKSRRYRDFNLWEAFVEDFEGFEKSTFDIADRTWVRDLRNHLRANGVFVYKQARLSITTQLCKVLAEDSPHKWTQEEINEQVESDEGFNSILVGQQSYRANSLTPSSQDIKQPIGQPVEQPITQPTAAHRLPNKVPGQQYGRDGPSSGSPPTLAAPSVTPSSPATSFSNVLLPQPDGPTTLTNSCGLMSRLMSTSAATGPRDDG
jgi:hypothetical protein